MTEISGAMEIERLKGRLAESTMQKEQAAERLVSQDDEIARLTEQLKLASEECKILTADNERLRALWVVKNGVRV